MSKQKKLHQRRNKYKQHTKENTGNKQSKKEKDVSTMSEQTPKEIIVSNEESIDVMVHNPKTPVIITVLTKGLPIVISIIMLIVSGVSCHTANESLKNSLKTSKNSLEISQDSFELNKKNQPLIIDEELNKDDTEESDSNDEVKYLKLTAIQGQVAKAYLSIKENDDFYIKKISFETEESETETGETIIKIPYRTYSTEEDDSDTLILSNDITHQLELLLYDTAGNYECYYLVIPRENTTSSFKITKENDKNLPNDISKVKIYQWIADPCIFNCNIINKKTINLNIADYNNNKNVKTFSDTVDADEIYKHINDTRDLIEK